MKANNTSCNYTIHTTAGETMSVYPNTMVKITNRRRSDRVKDFCLLLFGESNEQL